MNYLDDCKYNNALLPTLDSTDLAQGAVQQNIPSSGYFFAFYKIPVEHY